jgi:hypothetical protein
MLTKTTIVSLLTISLMAFAGIAYSQYTASISATANATAGTVSVNWYSIANDASSDGGATGTGSASYPDTTCATSPGTPTYGPLTFTATNLPPDGTGCVWDVAINNNGNIPATVTFSLPVNAANGFGPGTPNCFDIYITSASSISLAPGATSTPFTVYVYSPTDAPNGCQALTGSQSLTLTASG